MEGAPRVIQLRALRPFYANGARVEVGSLVSLPFALAAECIGAGKAEDVEGRLVPSPPATWTEVQAKDRAPHWRVRV